MLRVVVAIFCLVFSLGANAKFVSLWDNTDTGPQFSFDFDIDGHLGSFNGLQELGKAMSYLQHPHFDDFDQEGSFLDLWIQHVYENHPKLWGLLEKHPFFKDKIDAAVPVPAAMWLFASALALLISRRRATFEGA